ncbi:DNA repair exonuclease [uncultured Rhodoblastus sp.]|uniref:metallophosphoesterase family protein n=1 Tax=uncultured Rhodoblastus sp. TaxID=543037 RepID=UPI0025D1A463|nr:DNA repair exonuclease [uncultured Rhodoblastus sp.]
MSFTFLHAADLHLGSPLKGLALRDEALAQKLAGASRDAFVDLIDRALEENIAFAVFAGDIFDGDWRDASIALFFNRQIARLAKAGVASYLLKGNHDADSVVTRSLSLPDLAQQFPTGRAGTFELPQWRVALHGRGFSHRAQSENLARTYPAPRPGWFNIGVLHTSLDGRPGHAAYAPCSLDDLRAKNYDYWALGHVHAHEVVSRDPFVVYPGNLQGRHIRETGAKGAVLVDVAGGEVAGLRRLIVDRARFAEIVLDAAPHEETSALLRAVEACAKTEAEKAGGRLLALRIRLTGASALHGQFAADPAIWRDEIEAAAQRAHEDIVLERFSLETLPLAAPSTRPRGAPGASDFDFSALLDECLSDADLRAEALAALRSIENKFPPGVAPLSEELDALLAQARDLALFRAERQEGEA